MDFRNKLEYLSLVSLSSLEECLWVRPGTQPRVECLKDASLGQALALSANIRLSWKAKDKHNSLLRKSVNYGRKNFYSTGPRAKGPYFMLVIYKCSYQGRVFALAKPCLMFANKAGEPERCSSPRKVLGLTHKHQTSLESVGKDKHSSLL